MESSSLYIVLRILLDVVTVLAVPTAVAVITFVFLGWQMGIIVTTLVVLVSIYTGWQNRDEIKEWINRYRS